ncbi:Ribonuclease H-like superfamily protein [Gossypium australe]|uniref:Ribonuclease H-like superfamily protein n=1 Tax=Gossypium australe TaxID=47621 RepID=A0A5B6X9C7_9ROSI|nr:Ribonuclease H-like superfamily protein [Gossypium australe]
MENFNEAELPFCMCNEIEALTLLLPGVAFWGPDTFWRRESAGGLATGRRSIFGMMLGYQNLELEEFSSTRILAIPLVSSRPPDTLIWRGNNTGCYTVKSGYKRIITAGNPSLQTEDSTNFFTKLWAFKIPSKIRIFI